MKGGTLLYKCRLCGEIIRSVHAPGGLIAASCIVSGVDFPQKWGRGVKPGLLDIHACSDGVIGVTDFVGVEEDKDQRFLSSDNAEK